MSFARTGQVFLLIAALAAPSAMAGRSHRTPTSGHSHKIPNKAKNRLRGQRQIDSERAREIQVALIREKYLTGEPSGQWDAQTQSAMQKLQADNGWQTKIMPDSRALIKLGLGPASPGGTPVVSPAGSAIGQSALSQPQGGLDAPGMTGGLGHSGASTLINAQAASR